MESKTTSIAPAGAPDITAMMQAAVGQGEAGVRALQALVELQERLLDRESKAEYFEALHRFQRACPSIRKNKVAKIASRSGGDYSYSYADLDQIVAETRPHLHAAGLSFGFDSKLDGGLMTVTCVLRHERGHSESNTFACPTGSSNPGMSDAQKHASSFTFARRYALLGVLGLATTDDDVDGADMDAQVGPALSAERAATLQALIDSEGVDVAKFLRFFGVKAVHDLPDARYAEAVGMIQKRRAR